MAGKTPGPTGATPEGDTMSEERERLLAAAQLTHAERRKLGATIVVAAIALACLCGAGAIGALWAVTG